MKGPYDDMKGQMVSKEAFYMDLWRKADKTCYNSVNVREWCAANGVDETAAAEWVIKSGFMEYGISPMQPWFRGEP